MSSDLIDLLTFLHHGNTQIRQLAAQHLAPYAADPSLQSTLFKRNDREPLRDLKLLVRDYAPIARDAWGMVVDLTGSRDGEVVEEFGQDEAFVEEVVRRIVEGQPGEAQGEGEGKTEEGEMVDLACAVLANLVKDEKEGGVGRRIVGLERAVPKEVGVGVVLRRGEGGVVEAEKVERQVKVRVSESRRVLDQLMDCFVKGAKGALVAGADYDYLAYVFADLSRFEEGRRYLLERQEYDGVVPLTKLVVFLENGSLVRRKGVASTIKNCAFEVGKHEWLMASEGEGGVGLLPYLLLPLAGSEEFDAEDSEGMLDELMLLPPDKEREVDDDIIATHLETLLLLTTDRKGREKLRSVKVYPVVRELHLKREAEGIREGCERLADILMRDEEGGVGTTQKEVKKANDDHKIEEIF